MALGLALTLVLLAAPAAFAGSSQTYPFGRASGNTTNRDAIVEATNVLHSGGGTLTVYAFDIDNPGSATGTEETTVYISYDNQMTWTRLQWDYYQVSSGSYVFANFSGQSTTATYGNRIYSPSATAGDTSTLCANSRGCLIGVNNQFTRAVYTIPDFSAGFTPGNSVFIRIRLENSDYTGFEIDGASLEVFTNNPPTSSDITVATGSKYVFGLSDFPFADADSASDGDQFETLRIVWLPSSGSVEYYTGSTWQPVTLYQEFTPAELQQGILRADTDFEFEVSDGYEYSETYLATVSANTTQPGVTLAGPASVSGVPFDVTITFSEDVTGFDLSDLTVTGGTATAFSGSGANYTATITPDPGATVQITVPAGVAENALANTNTVSNVLHVEDTIDTDPPTVAITGPTAVVTAAFDVTITFNKDVTGLELSELTVVNGTATALSGSGTTYVATITPQPDSLIEVSLAAAVAQDAWGNDNTVSNTYRIGSSPETTPPTVVIAGPQSFSGDTFQITITFSADVTGFDLADLVVIGGRAMSMSGSGSVYSAIIRPEPGALIQISLAEGIAQNGAGIGNTASNVFEIQDSRDGTPPDVVITGPQSFAGDRFQITITFSAAVTGFDLADLVVIGGTAESMTGSGSVYSAIIRPEPGALIQISLAEGIAVNAAGIGNTASNMFEIQDHRDLTPPGVVISGPDAIVEASFQVAITFDEAVTGLERSEITVRGGSVTSLTGSGAAYTAAILPEFGKPVQISLAEAVAQDAAGNDNTASNTYQVQAADAEYAFRKYEDKIRSAVQDEAVRNLRGTLTANRRMVQNARDRFIAGQGAQSDCDTAAETSQNIPFDLSGSADASAGAMNSSGTFFQQTGNCMGTERRLIYGDFFVLRDEDGSVTAAVAGNLAWERMVSDRTMLGYFVRLEAGNSDISSSFTGTNNHYGLSGGGYAVHEIRENLLLDGYMSVGVGRNDLKMSNSVLRLDSDYTTRSATAGLALSGIHEWAGAELRPELSVSYGKTWIGEMDFTAHAYGLKQSGLKLDAGAVSVIDVMLRPEIRVALDGLAASDSNLQVSFSPRFICEKTRTDRNRSDCGGGAEAGLLAASEDGLKSLDLLVVMDRVNSETRTSGQLDLAFRF